MQRAMLRSTLGVPALFAAFAALVGACSGAPRPPAKQPDGSYDLSCRGPLTSCLRGAERVCGDRGYTVTSAHHFKELLGHKSGQSQIGIERSDATVTCGTAPAEAPIRLQREQEVPAASAEAPLPAAPPARACVPGATQACVGPAGCSGGQVCATDGSRFEACDCGAPAPATSPASP